MTPEMFVTQGASEFIVNKSAHADVICSTRDGLRKCLRSEQGVRRFCTLGTLLLTLLS